MVTKHGITDCRNSARSVLAKIFMVTKLNTKWMGRPCCSVLAKIFMVTKPFVVILSFVHSSVLAKIFMVTKRV